MSAQTVDSPWSDLLATIEAARDASLSSRRARRRRTQSAWHRQMMTEYYAAREAYEVAREKRTRGYDTENAEDREYHKPYTLRRHLEGLARPS